MEGRKAEGGNARCSSAFFLRSEPANLRGGLAYSCLRHVPERVWTSPLSRRPWAGASHDAENAANQNLLLAMHALDCGLIDHIQLLDAFRAWNKRAERSMAAGSP